MQGSGRRARLPRGSPSEADPQLLAPSHLALDPKQSAPSELSGNLGKRQTSADRNVVFTASTSAAADSLTAFPIFWHLVSESSIPGAPFCSIDLDSIIRGKKKRKHVYCYCWSGSRSDESAATEPLAGRMRKGGAWGRRAARSGRMRRGGMAGADWRAAGGGAGSRGLWL